MIIAFAKPLRRTRARRLDDRALFVLPNTTSSPVYVPGGLHWLGRVVEEEPSPGSAIARSAAAPRANARGRARFTGQAVAEPAGPRPLLYEILKIAGARLATLRRGSSVGRAHG